MLDFDIALWAMGAAIVVGLMQWAKKLLDKPLPNLPSWAWSFVLPACSFGAGFAYGGDKPVWNSLGIWAIAQLGYLVIIKTVEAKLGGMKNGTE